MHDHPNGKFESERALKTPERYKKGPSGQRKLARVTSNNCSPTLWPTAFCRKWDIYNDRQKRRIFFKCKVYPFALVNEPLFCMEADLERNFLETGIDASKVTLKVVSNFWNSLLSSPIWTKLSKSRNAQNTRTKGTCNFFRWCQQDLTPVLTQLRHNAYDAKSSACDLALVMKGHSDFTRTWYLTVVCKALHSNRLEIGLSCLSGNFTH